MMKSWLSHSVAEESGDNRAEFNVSDSEPDLEASIDGLTTVDYRDFCNCSTGEDTPDSLSSMTGESY